MLRRTFLDTKNVEIEQSVITFVYRKETKLLIPCILESPNCHKRNTIIGDLHKLKRIFLDFDGEIRAIKNKYSNAGYPIHFVHSIKNYFNKPPADNVSLSNTT